MRYLHHDTQRTCCPSNKRFLYIDQASRQWFFPFQYVRKTYFVNKTPCEQCKTFVNYPASVLARKVCYRFGQHKHLQGQTKGERISVWAASSAYIFVLRTAVKSKITHGLLLLSLILTIIFKQAIRFMLFFKCNADVTFIKISAQTVNQISGWY